LTNVLYLPTRYFPSISGAEFYIQRIAEILTSKFNYNADIFTSNAVDFRALRHPEGKIIEKTDPLFDRVNNLKINRFSITYNHSFEDILSELKKLSFFNSINITDNSVKKYLINGPYLKSLIEFFLRENVKNYDIIHTVFFPYFNIIISLIIGNFLNIPKICTPFFHFSNPRYLDSNMVDILKRFDTIIACTQIEKKVLVNKFNLKAKKIAVVPMGVDIKRYNIKEIVKSNKAYFKEKFFATNEKNYKLILFCGHKNYEKGAISILKAIPYILEKIKKVYFVFIGPSTKAFNYELSKILKNKNSRIINFSPDNLTGYYDNKKIAAFREADLYLMPSRSDAFGISFLEAWSAGKPVIGARIGATPEVIRENVDGFLVEFDNPEDIAQKVIKLLKSKKLRKNLGTAGYLNVSQKYRWELVAKKTHLIYQNLIKNNLTKI